MRKISLLIILLSFGYIYALAQDWTSIITDTGKYAAGEGWGKKLEEADQEAISDLASRICISVVSSFRQVEEQSKDSSGSTFYSSQSSILSLNSSLSLIGTTRIVLSKGREWHVVRYIEWNKIEQVFHAREERAKDFEESAYWNERMNNCSEALKLYSWSYALLQSLPVPSSVKGRNGEILINYIPQRIGRILEDIKVYGVGHYDDCVKLKFQFRGQDVSKLIFDYFDGTRWRTNSEVNGVASINLASGAPGNIIQIKIDYIRKGDAIMDGEIYELLSIINLQPIRASYKVFRISN